MDGQGSKNRPRCPVEDLAAYLDGELGGEAEAALEAHLATCSACRSELNSQKLLLNQLNREFANGDVELPEDFSLRIVVAAESRVSGLRSADELRSATLILVVCGIIAALFLSVSKFGGEIPAISIAGRIVGAATLIAHLFYDLSLAMITFTRASIGFLSVTALYAIPVGAVLLLAVLLVKRRKANS